MLLISLVFNQFSVMVLYPPLKIIFSDDVLVVDFDSANKTTFSLPLKLFLY